MAGVCQPPDSLRRSVVSLRPVSACGLPSAVSVLFPFDSLMKPQCHELCIGDPLSSRHAFEHGDIDGVQAQGNRLASGAGDVQRFCPIQKSLNALRAFLCDGGIPFVGFFRQTISYLFREPAHFFVLLR